VIVRFMFCSLHVGSRDAIPVMSSMRGCPEGGAAARWSAA